MKPDEIEPAHCLGGDRKCTCPCGKGLRPEFSALREERGRICAACQYEEEYAQAKAEEAVMASCICWPTDFSGKSVCGVPCPAHPKCFLCQSAAVGRIGAEPRCERHV